MPRGFYKHEDRITTTSEEMLQMYQSGMSSVDIGREFNISAQTVFDRFKRIGVKGRNYSEARRLLIKQGKINIPKGKDHPAWKGGKYIDGKGYVWIRINTKSVLEHKYIWESQNGKIRKGWIIHHLNGVKDDNRVENLCAMPRKIHSPKSIVEPFKKRIRELETQINNLKS